MVSKFTRLQPFGLFWVKRFGMRVQQAGGHFWGRHRGLSGENGEGQPGECKDAGWGHRASLSGGLTPQKFRLNGRRWKLVISETFDWWSNGTPCKCRILGPIALTVDCLAALKHCTFRILNEMIWPILGLNNFNPYSFQSLRPGSLKHLILPFVHKSHDHFFLFHSYRSVWCSANCMWQRASKPLLQTYTYTLCLNLSCKIYFFRNISLFQKKLGGIEIWEMLCREWVSKIWFTLSCSTEKRLTPCRDI